MNLPLETERLRVRLFVEDDLEALASWLLDPEVNRWLLLNLHTLDDIRPRIDLYRRRQEELGFSFWALERKTDGVVVGGCGLLPIGWEGPDVEIAWHLRRDCWGNGYATEAARAVLQYGLENLGIPQIWAILSSENLASRRVAQRTGMAFVNMGGYKNHSHDFYVAPEVNVEATPLGPDVTPLK